MNLEIIRTRTTWNDAAGSINNNYAKIADAIAQLKANGGGGGGGADIDLTAYATKVWVEAKGYITASTLTPYALKTDIPSLVGYATEDFVNNKLVNYAPLTSIQGFENRIGGLEGAVPTLNTKVTEVEGDVATLSEDITKVEEGLSSLEETLKTEHPTNGDLESAIVELNISQYLPKTEASTTYATIASVSTLQTTVSNQAKTILANEQGLEELRTTVGDLGDAIPTNNNQLDNGAGYITSAALAPYALTSQIPTSLPASDVYAWAKAATKPSYAWSEITSRPTALSQFTDDVVAGKYLPLSGGTINGTAVQPLYLKSNQSSCGILFFNSTDNATLMYSGGSNWRVTDNGWSNAYYLLHSGNIGNYNAGSATKLQTPRTLWGQSFDGTRNITGHLWSDTWRIVTDATFDGAFFQSKNYDGTSNAGNIYLTGWDVNTLESFNVRAKNSYFSNNVIASGLFMNIGKEISPYASNRAEIALINPNAEPSMLRLGSNGDVKWGIETRGSTDNYAFSIYSWTAATHCLRILNNGNVGIGNTSPTEKLDVAGNVKASGNINATSITINGVTITASNGSITVNGNVFATGDITGGV
jgi:hypothetical protein